MMYQKKWAAIGIAAALAVSMAGCAGSTTAEPSAAPSDGAVADVGSLTVVYPAFSTTGMLVYVAKERGFFSDRGLDVEIKDGQTAVGQTLVVSGQADILGAGQVGGALAVAMQGQDTSMIMATVGGGLAGFVVGNPDTTPTLDSLADTPNCRINTFAVGTPAYAYAELLKQREKLDNCEIVPSSDGIAANAAVATGQASANVTGYSVAATQIADGSLTALVDTREPGVVKDVYGVEVMELADWGMTANLEKKKDAVAAYVAGCIEAYQWIQDSSDEEVAAVMQTYTGFQSQASEVVAAQVAAARPLLWKGSDDGFITESQWKDTVDFFALSGIEGFDADSPMNAYDARVNMSFYEQATK